MILHIYGKLKETKHVYFGYIFTFFTLTWIRLPHFLISICFALETGQKKVKRVTTTTLEDSEPDGLPRLTQLGLFDIATSPWILGVFFFQCHKIRIFVSISWISQTEPNKFVSSGYCTQHREKWRKENVKELHKPLILWNVGNDHPCKKASATHLFPLWH